MKSVKTKIIVLVSVFVVFSSVIIGGFSIINSRKALENDSIEILNILCENKSNDINNLLLSTESSVQTLMLYAQRQINSIDELKDAHTTKQYIQKLIDISINAAENTQGAETVYIRLNPQLAGSKSGFFYQKNASANAFEARTPTDLDAYPSDDQEHVGWYYQPIKNKKATWIAPYYNRNINKEIISYVIPYYIDDELVGVVGMDIDFSILQDIVFQTNVYQTGYAFLLDQDANVIYHKNILTGANLFTYNDGEFKNLAAAIQNDQPGEDNLIDYNYQKISKVATFRTLLNSMRLVIGVPQSEINSQADDLLIQISGAMFVIVTIAIILTFIFTKRLVKPLLELTDASQRIANGHLDVSIAHQSNDEVGILAESFRQTVVHLNNYFSYVNKLAYKDSLTSVKNKTAYLEAVELVEQDIEEGKAEFAVIVFDINGLKDINDHFGHNAGDLLIIHSCQIICKAFQDFPVYRIGGDEFVVILQDADETTCFKSLQQFEIEIKNHNQKGDMLQVSIAKGISVYSPQTDSRFNNVFERADKEMYKNKSEIKKAK